MPNTIRLHRVLRAPPKRIYRAFLDPDAMVKWLPPNGFTGKVQRLDARVGGGYAMSFANLGDALSGFFDPVWYLSRYPDVAASGTELVNPGSVGMPFDGDQRAAYALLHDDDRIEHRRVEYDFQASADAVRQRFGEAPWIETVVRRITTARF